jgi:hypothetical protein
MKTGLHQNVSRPKAWKYLLGGAIALFLLIPLWIAFDLIVLRPEAATQPETTMSKLWWFGTPLIVVTLLFSGRWAVVTHHAATRQAQFDAETARAQQQLAEAKTEQGRREYVLEVISMGVTLDKYRQGKLWDALQKGGAFVSIREQDPEKYPWREIDKLQTSGGRSGDALENGALYSVTEWGVPVFNARPPSHNPKNSDTPIFPDAGLVSSAGSSGMITHLFAVGPRKFEERPDRILEDVFDFFDSNPDIPYVILNSDDGLDVRNMNIAEGSPALVKDGYYIPSMPDSSTIFLLARRERVELVRPFVYEDVSNEESVMVLNRDAIGRRLFLLHSKLMRTLPTPERLQDPNASSRRFPLVDEWLPEAAKFSVRHDIRGTGPTSFLDRNLEITHRPPLDWKPTPWFPVPWNTVQLATFDKMPTLGFIHRPVFVKMTDDDGKPLARRDARANTLLEGVQQALQTLPEAERAKGPQRVIAATGDQQEHILALEGMLYRYAEQGGPEIDSGKINQFINLDRRLGNTGAATLLMQMAIGVMGSYRDGGTSMAINLRDPNEASIIFISPPSDEKRKTQEHVRGGDVFRHIRTLAIDPANYAPPVAVDQE